MGDRTRPLNGEATPLFNPGQGFPELQQATLLQATHAGVGRR